MTNVEINKYWDAFIESLNFNPSGRLLTRRELAIKFGKFLLVNGEPRPCKACNAKEGEPHTFDCSEAQD